MNELTDREQLIVDAVLEGVEQKMTHTCAFQPEERKVLHDFIDAVDKEGADGETHIIVLRFGNGIREAMKKVTSAVTWVLLLCIACAVYFLFVRPWVGK